MNQYQNQPKEQKLGQNIETYSLQIKGSAGVLLQNKMMTSLIMLWLKWVYRKILLGILGVETYFEEFRELKVMDSLYTLATGYPPRAKFFRSELINLFYLCREEDFSILDIKGSYAGAMGAAQFISSSYRNYAVDGNDDGKIDLFNSWDDILMSIGNYLKENGWDASKQIYSRHAANEMHLNLIKP